MLSDIEVKEIIANLLQESPLATTISGGLYTDSRPVDSNKEDAIVSVADNRNGQIQTAQAEVRLYVPDLPRADQWEANTARLKELARLGIEQLENVVTDSYTLELESQLCIKVEGRNEHYICNGIRFKTVNF